MSNGAADVQVDPSTMNFAEGGEPLSPREIAQRSVQKLADKDAGGGADPATPVADPPAADPAPATDPAQPVAADSLIPADVLGEPAPADPAQPEPIPEPTDMSESQAAAFKAMREKIEALEAAQKPAQDAVPTAEVEELQKQLSAARAELASHDLTKDPAFVDQYLKPRQHLGAQIVKLVQDFGGDKDLPNQLVRMDMKSRMEVLSEQLPQAAALLASKLADYDVRTQMANDALRNHQVTRRQLQSQQTANNQRLVEQSFDSALMELKGQKHPLLQESAADENWTNGVRHRIDRGRKLMEAENPQDRARIALAAAMADDYRVLVDSQQKAIAQLRAELAQYRSASPDLGQSGSLDAPPPKPGDNGKHDRSKPMSGKEIAALVASRNKNRQGAVA